MKYEHIPAEMKELRQWVYWGQSKENPKMPFSPLTRKGADASGPATWGSFDEAVRAVIEKGLTESGGIGFEFGEEGGLAGIDLDHVINEAGELDARALDIVEMMNTYTEYSPSNSGLHIMFKITKPLKSISTVHKKKIESGKVIEVYDTGRYFRVTGRIYGEPKAIEERTEALKKVCDKYLAKPEKTKNFSQIQAPQFLPTPQTLSDSDLWERMFNAPNGREIRALYDGDISGYGSHSEADLALCNHLAFWTGKDVLRMDRMFRQSGLYNNEGRAKKWNEIHGTQTYGALTIERAIADTIETYNGDIYSGGYTSTREKKRETKKSPGLSPVDVKEKETPELEMKPVSEYLNDFMQELMKSREGRAISTGFDELDKLLDGGLYPGLYVLGAISSLGKTTLALQIADNIAKNGYDVLIFSLEMSRWEMMAKTISRESLLLDLSENNQTKNALSTRGVLRMSNNNNSEQQAVARRAIESYIQWGKKLMIIEGIGDIGTSKIRECLDKLKVHGCAPVVIIDYLQILAPVEIKATDKQNVDKNVLELKRISRDYQIPVIGISSFNRESYNAPVSMAAFKESGAIEYSSDVLLGMQIDGIERAPKEKPDEYKERVQRTLDEVDIAKKKGSAFGIELKILKNRNGTPGRIHFEFHSVFNFFMERGSSIL